MSHKEIQNDYEREVEELALFMESLEDEDPDIKQVKGWLPPTAQGRVDVIDYNPE